MGLTLYSLIDEIGPTRAMFRWRTLQKMLVFSHRLAVVHKEMNSCAIHYGIFIVKL